MPDVIVRYLADTKELERGLKNIEQQNGKVGDTAVDAGKKTTTAIKGADEAAKKSADTFRRLGTAIVAAFAVQRVISFTREMANLGVQLETTAQRMRVVFGGAARDVEKASKDMAQSLGLSVNQFNLMASQVGDVLVPLGLARDQAAKMSTEAVKLAGSLSEFSAGQVDTGQAVHALIGAFTGEREALKTLGVVINETDLQARLAQKGQKNLQGQALATAKAYATFELILERSADAQTFFTKNADSAARTQAELRAETQTLREEFAKRLSPAINSATKSIIELVKNIDPDDVIRFAKAIVAIGTGFATYKIAKRIGDFAVALKALTAPTGIGLVIGLVSSLASGIALLAGDTKDAAKETKELTEFQQRLADIEKEATDSTNKEVGALIKLTNEIRRAKNGSKERNELIKELNNQYGTTLENLSDEELFTRKLNQNYEDIVKSIKEKVAIQSQEKRLIAIYEEQAQFISNIALGLRNINLNKLSESLGTAGVVDLTDKVKSLSDVIDILTSVAGKSEKDLNVLEKRVLSFVRSKGFDKDNPVFFFLSQLASLDNEVDETLKSTQAVIDLLTNATTTPIVTPTTPDKKKAVKEEKQTQDEINEVIRKANEKMFKETLEAEEKFYKIQRTEILNNEELTQEERAEKLKRLEDNYLKDRIETYETFAMETFELELALAERTEEERQKLFEAEEARKDKGLESTKKTEELKREVMQQTQQALINTANIVLDLGQQVADDALGLAIFQVLLNKAVAVSEAVKAAIAAAAATGPAAPIVTPLLIAELTGIVLGAFGATNNLINQAQQSRSNSRRFSRGGIMIEGDGSSTGDGIHAMISPRESIINANATRKHYEELLAINSGTFDKLVNAKYILPALKGQKTNVVVDAGFSDERLYGQLKKTSNEEKRRHKEVINALNKRTPRRKQM